MLEEANRTFYTRDKKEAETKQLKSFRYMWVFIPKLISGEEVVFCRNITDFHKLLIWWGRSQPTRWSYSEL